MDQAAVISKVLGGDIDAYGELVRECQSSVRACLAVRLHDVSATDDIAQEAFIIAFRKLKEFDPGKEFGPWVRSIAIHCMQNHLRKKRPLGVGDADLLSRMLDAQLEKDHPAEKDGAGEQLRQLSICLEKMAPPQRALIEKRYFQNESIASIKESLGLAHSTVTMRLHRLREELRRCIEQRSSERTAS